MTAPPTGEGGGLWEESDLKKRNIFAVLGGALVLGVAYLIGTVATVVALVVGFEAAEGREAH